MLNTDCEHFRDLFEPSGHDPELDAHRHVCATCAAWAARLEVFLGGGEPRRPLPEALRQRLRSVPRGQVSCGEVERLWEGAVQRARTGTVHDPRVAEHLRTCGRCAALYGTVGAALAAFRTPLPRALFERLRSIVRRPALPWWIRDGHVAVAASAILTVTLTAFVGDPVPLMAEAKTSLNARAASLAGEVEARYADGLEQLERLEVESVPYREMWQRARDFYERQVRDELIPGSAPKGDDDGEKVRDGNS